MMFKTYRNYHRSEERARAMAESEQARGVSCGGWYRQLTDAEERAALRQEAINNHNANVLMREADSLAEALGG